MGTVMRSSYNMLDKRRKAVLKKIMQVGPFIMATPTYLKVRCGNQRCKCARDRKNGHEKLHLSWSEAGGKNGTCR